MLTSDGSVFVKVNVVEDVKVIYYVLFLPIVGEDG